MAAKDWSFLSIAVLALCVSVATALFNVVLQFDDLRVVLGRNPLVEIRASELTVSGDQELTFINSGNRAAAITDISAVARRIVVPGDEQVCHSPSASRFEELFTFAPMELDAKPFILKAGEILFVKTAII